jgi:hypothetical protein
MPNLLLYEIVKLMCSPEWTCVHQFALEITHLAPNPLLSLTRDAVKGCLNFLNIIILTACLLFYLCNKIMFHKCLCFMSEINTSLCYKSKLDMKLVSGLENMQNGYLYKHVSITSPIWNIPIFGKI